MKVTSKRGERTVALDAAETRLLDRAAVLLDELADLSGSKAAAAATVGLREVLREYGREPAEASAKA